MIAIKDFGLPFRQCKRDGCAEITCAQHPRAVIGETLPGRFGIPTDKCPDILSQVSDDKLDVIFRYWVKNVLIKKKQLPFPPQLREIAEREGVKDSMPFNAVEAVLDAIEWPAAISDERRKEAIANLFGDVRQEIHGSPQIRRWGDCINHGEA